MAKKNSDKGCPDQMTVGSGLGAGKIPLMVPASGGPLRPDMADVLVRDFNTRLAHLAYLHCTRGGCIPNWEPATVADIKYRTKNWRGWYDVYHMEVVRRAVAAGHASPPSSSHPIYAPLGDKYGPGAYIDPNYINVWCSKPVFKPLDKPPRGFEPPKPPEEPPVEPPKPPKPPKPPRLCKPDIRITVSVQGGAPVAAEGQIDCDFDGSSSLNHAVGPVRILRQLVLKDTNWSVDDWRFKAMLLTGAMPNLPQTVVTPGLPTKVTGRWSILQYISKVTTAYFEASYTCPICGETVTKWFAVTLP